MNEHFPNPKGVTPHNHSSKIGDLGNAAGGEVPREQYERPVPASQQGPTPSPKD